MLFQTSLRIDLLLAKAFEDLYEQRLQGWHFLQEEEVMYYMSAYMINFLN